MGNTLRKIANLCFKSEKERIFNSIIHCSCHLNWRSETSIASFIADVIQLRRSGTLKALFIVDVIQLRRSDISTALFIAAPIAPEERNVNSIIH